MTPLELVGLRQQIAQCQGNIAVKRAQVCALAGMERPCDPIAAEIDTLLTILEVLVQDLRASLVVSRCLH